MTIADLLDAVPTSREPAAAGVGTVRFVGPVDRFWLLLIRGALLLMVTLGIYRFWLVTDIRRYLWSGTEIAGDSLEYLGTGRELLLGFLIAIAMLMPVYAGFFVAALDTGVIGQSSSLAAVVLLAVLGQFAVYRARRYRLTRTIFRGLRFHQEGSGWRYAVCALFWWVVSALTLGLAYPWGQASLERYKMRNTFYGDLQGRFVGSGARLFLRGVLLWIVVVVPLLVGVAVSVAAVDWQDLAEAMKNTGGDFGKFEGANPALAGSLLYLMLAPLWAVIAAALLYPAYQGIVLRWWLEGLRFGDITLSSRLRKRSVYGVYVRFLWHSLAFSLLVAIVIGAVFLVGGLTMAGATDAFGKSPAAEFLMVALLLLVYVATALGFSTIFQATVRLGLWRVGFESIDLKGLEALDRVKAAGQLSSALGEGLADALNVGGY
jgi:uncharacterized membrane protein YjgN (DUF898 family)